MRKTMVMFILLAVAQVALVLGMIASHEMLLRQGKQIKLRTAPVDPYDPFRGRFVTLDFDIARDIKIATREDNFMEGKQIYLLLREDDQGLAQRAGWSFQRPVNQDYIKATVRYMYNQNASVTLPCDRYYLDEDLAPKAEKVYRDYSRRDTREAYVTARIQDGRMALEELFIAGVPIKEFVRRETKK